MQAPVVMRPRLATDIHSVAATIARGRTSVALATGMQLSAEIVQGKRTVLEYLLSPVQRVASEAATER